MIRTPPQEIVLVPISVPILCKFQDIHSNAEAPELLLMSKLPAIRTVTYGSQGNFLMRDNSGFCPSAPSHLDFEPRITLALITVIRKGATRYSMKPNWRSVKTLNP